MISVVIPTRNRADLLAQTLESLTQQTLDSSEFEILVVDNGSNDTTSDVIELYKSRFSNLIGIYDAQPGLHVGRHAGMLASKGDLLVFADDDIAALPTWLESIRNTFMDSKAAMVGGNNYPLFIGESPGWLKKMWNRPHLKGCKAIPALSVIEFIQTPKEISPYYIWGCNFAIRKDVLLAAGGFHPDGMPKELIRFRGDGETHVSRFVEESGMKCLFHPGASVYHKVTPERMTFEYFYQRGFNQGVSDSYTALRSQNEEKNVPTNRSWIYRAVKWGIRKILSLRDDIEIKQALIQLEIGHCEGFAFHQRSYREDPEVQEWVHRPIYY